MGLPAFGEAAEEEKAICVDISEAGSGSLSVSVGAGAPWWPDDPLLSPSASQLPHSHPVLVNNRTGPILASRWLSAGEVCVPRPTNCGENLASSLGESGSPVGGGVRNSIVGKCQGAFCSASD